MTGIIRNCNKYGNEDTINQETGLCPSCNNEIKDRNLEYERKFRAYLFKGSFERHKAICKNINVRAVRNGEVEE